MPQPASLKRLTKRLIPSPPIPAWAGRDCFMGGVKLEFAVHFPGFRRRVRGLMGVGIQPRIEFGLGAIGAAQMRADGQPRKIS